MTLNPSSTPHNRILAIGLNTSAPERWADFFLLFSPHLTFRIDSVEKEHRVPFYWFFLDLQKNRSWIEHRYRKVTTLGRAEAAEACLLNEIISSARRARFSDQDETSELYLGIADTSAQAQALAKTYGFWISEPGAGARDVGRLPLQSLLSLEGLKAWDHLRTVTSLIDFFSLLGFETISDLVGLTREAFSERWGQIGSRIYSEIIDDRQSSQRGFSTADCSSRLEAISPYQTTLPIESQVVLDFPISVVALLLHAIEESIRSLFLRLEGRRLYARRLSLKLRLEYSNIEQDLEIEPSVPSRDLRFYMTLIERKLDGLSLINPVKDIEIRIQPDVENEVQDGFGDDSVSDHKRLSLLTSLLKQEGLDSGYAVLEPELLPEKAWTLSLESTRRPDSSVSPKTVPAQLQIETFSEPQSEQGFRPKAEYSVAIHEAARPTLIHNEPELLTPLQLKRRQFLSARPIEKIESEWWTKASDVRRDYYFAKTTTQAVEWIYEDTQSGEFFVHGVFD